ncbi:Pycsar system effector family protein [Pleomorphovibrio marinus]|uniref:Pycsar system effector family protein n=1 Tax=Pleomorphovibrio marinus TaxID=2164132 RepID=UPI000E0C2B67|nr:Pycsar system effector family protein [Pleomorphovibrio marinus]
MKLNFNSLISFQGSGEDNLKFKEEFLKLQVTYFSAHLRHADAKAAGIIAFTAAITKIIADRITWANGMENALQVTLSYVLLALAFITIMFSIFAVFPRFTKSKLINPNNSFSWSTISSIKPTTRNTWKHYDTITKKDNLKLLEDISESTAYLAQVIRKKYRWIRLAIFTLILDLLLITLLWSLDVFV